MMWDPFVLSHAPSHRGPRPGRHHPPSHWGGHTLRASPRTQGHGRAAFALRLVDRSGPAIPPKGIRHAPFFSPTSADSEPRSSRPGGLRADQLGRALHCRVPPNTADLRHRHLRPGPAPAQRRPRAIAAAAAAAAAAATQASRAAADASRFPRARSPGRAVRAYAAEEGTDPPCKRRQQACQAPTPVPPNRCSGALASAVAGWSTERRAKAWRRLCRRCDGESPGKRWRKVPAFVLMALGCLPTKYPAPEHCHA